MTFQSVKDRAPLGAETNPSRKMCLENNTKKLIDDGFVGNNKYLFNINSTFITLDTG